MSTSEEKIRAISLWGSGAPTTIAEALSLLRPRLPFSLPLYRRLQFGRFTEFSTLLTNLASLDEPSLDGARPAGPWMLAFVDRATRPESEAWVFGSWEASEALSASASTTAAASLDEDADAERVGLARALGHAIHALGVPRSIHHDILHAALLRHAGSSPDAAGAAPTPGDYISHATNPAILLCGAVRPSTLQVLSRAGLIAQSYRAGHESHDVYVFDVDRLPPASTSAALPPGLAWGVLDGAEGHFARVRARTSIPRQERTLAVLPNLAIFATARDGGGDDDKDSDAPQPVAWAFVQLDGSLSSLHVEPEWRRRGLAKLLVAKLLRENMDRFWEAQVPTHWAHAYVTVGNDESTRLCQSLGGRADWRVVWARLYLGAL